MPAIISDRHPGDGTTSSRIPAHAWHLLAGRPALHLAPTGVYHPIEEADVTLTRSGAHA